MCVCIYNSNNNVLIIIIMFMFNGWNMNRFETTSQKLIGMCPSRISLGFLLHLTNLPNLLFRLHWHGGKIEHQDIFDSPERLNHPEPR